MNRRFGRLGTPEEVKHRRKVTNSVLSKKVGINLSDAEEHPKGCRAQSVAKWFSNHF